MILALLGMSGAGALVGMSASVVLSQGSLLGAASSLGVAAVAIGVASVFGKKIVDVLDHGDDRTRDGRTNDPAILRGRGELEDMQYGQRRAAGIAGLIQDRGQRLSLPGDDLQRQIMAE